MLRALRERFGADRRAAVCRELTKTYEEVIRGTLRELLEWAESSEVRGEIAVVVGGAPEREPGRPEDHVAAVNGLIAQGIRLKEAVAAVAETRRSASANSMPRCSPRGEPGGGFRALRPAVAGAGTGVHHSGCAAAQHSLDRVVRACIDLPVSAAVPWQ